MVTVSLVWKDTHTVVGLIPTDTLRTIVSSCSPVNFPEHPIVSDTNMYNNPALLIPWPPYCNSIISRVFLYSNKM